MVGCVAVMGGAMALWLRTTALDTDTFTETVAPLPQDPEVATALANVVVDQVFADAELEQKVRQALPGGLGFMAAPVAAGIEDLAVDIAEEIISSDAFGALWSTTTRLAHAQSVAVITGRDAVLIGPGGAVSLNLDETADSIRSSLEAAGLGDLLPAPREGGAVVVLFDGDQQSSLQFVVDLLDLTYFALPLLALASLGTALWLSSDRRRTLFAIAVGVSISSAAGLLLIDLARGQLLGAIDNEELVPAITDTWDILFRNLVATYASLLVFALIVAGISWLLGWHPVAVATRSALTSRLRGLAEQGGDPDNRVGAFVRQHAAALRLAGTVGVIAGLMLWPGLTIKVLLAGVVVLLLYLAAIRLLGADPAADRGRIDA
ncbi:MAG: hypothetical protein ACR2OI_00325 [Acidimicrobiia bacterium]